MNALTTQCPQCTTQFRVTAEQLDARNGMVRCGRCGQVFNARAQMHDNEHLSAETELPATQTPDEMPPEEVVTELPSPASSAESYQPPEFIELNEPVELPQPDEIRVPSFADSIVDEAEDIKHEFHFDEPAPAAPIEEAPPKKPLRWPWLLGAAFLLLILSAQVLYFYRIEFAARMPGLKPALQQYCSILQCDITLPKKIDLISIDASDLEASSQQASIIMLSAQLHNRASYTQAYPNIELSLTDIHDKVIARRDFTPAMYLKTQDNELLGFAANREISVKLQLDTTDLKPDGYKLFLYYQ